MHVELSEQQKQTIREWVTAGASLSDIQKQLKSDFNIVMTYMDVRLLVLEMNAVVQDKPEPKPTQPIDRNRSPSTAVNGRAMPSHLAETDDDSDLDRMPSCADDTLEEEPSPLEEGSVSLTLDSVVVPGAMVSGDVVFSDGIKARWVIDNYGRFGLDPETPGYRPSPEDTQLFQQQLRSELQRKGYM